MDSWVGVVVLVRVCVGKAGLSPPWDNAASSYSQLFRRSSHGHRLATLAARTAATTLRLAGSRMSHPLSPGPPNYVLRKQTPKSLPF